ncbi:MAG: hypothetical protein ACE5GY_10200 [Thermodesulfobacteriota bacterium]
MMIPFSTAFSQGRPGFLAVLAAAVLFFSVSASVAAPVIDRESAECLGCHEAAVSPDEPFQICHEAGCNHRIGTDYRLASSQDPTLAPPDRLDPGIRLVDGRLSCVTCHVAYSASGHEALSARRALIPQIPDPMLSVDNTGSGLCLSCHLK